MELVDDQGIWSTSYYPRDGRSFGNSSHPNCSLRGCLASDAYGSESQNVRFFLPFFVIVLAGCSAEQRAYLKYAEVQAKMAYDAEAEILLQAPCAMNVGSYWRVLNDDKRKAVDNLCGK